MSILDPPPTPNPFRFLRIRDAATGEVSGEVELTQLQLEAIMESLERKGMKAIAANQAFLAIASPTAAQVRDQVILLTKENTALLRLALRQLNSEDGT